MEEEYYTTLRKNTFTAKLHVSNFRRRENKIFLSLVNEDGIEFRDHCWVDYKNRVSVFLSKQRYKPNTSMEITFTASVYKYMSSEGDKYGLKELRSIQRIK